MLTEPVKDLGKAEFVPVDRAVDERVSVHAFDLNVKAMASQEDVGGGESDALIAIHDTSDMIPIKGIRTHAGRLFNS